jgi:cytidyltransferase-like protein
MKFREFLTEARPQGKVIVVYGGGFQPFHAGHMSSYEQAKRAFPSADFYVAASNDTKNRPIPFKDKQFLAQQAGVQDHFVQVSQPVNPTEILSHYNPKKDILILVRSERDPVNYTKKDGSPAYYQPFKSLKDCVPFNPDGGHGYIFVTKKHVFKVNGEEVYSGSQIRSMYSKADDKGRKSIINGLYPKATKQVKVKQLLDKYIGGLNEQINLDESFNELLFEGVHDKAIFKVVFLAGGPGSGKDYVLDNTLAGHGMTEMNSDKALEFLMDKEGLDKTMPASEEEKRNLTRGKAKNITELRQRLAILGRNGLIINGTGDDVEKITKIKKKLEDVGYESSMVLVNTADEVSKQRNIERGQRGGRTVPENIRKEKWDNVQAGRPEFAKLFGDKYMEFDNSEDLRTAPPEVVKAKKDEMLQMFTKIKEFVAKPPENPVASAWIAMELQKKDTLPVPKGGAEQTAHPDSGAAEEARKMGLQYYGFGRYGRDGKVTHRVVHDKLVEVEKEPHKEPNVPTSGSSMKKPEPKKVNEEFEQFLSESVTVSITGDTVEEVQSMMSSMQTGYTEEQDNTYHGLSNHSESLTLGKTMNVIGEKQYSQEVTNDDINAIFEEKKVKLLRGKDGKPRIFLIRRSAAKESHLRGGEVMKHPKGYVIKIKEENDNVETSKELFEQSETTKRRSTSTFLAEGRIANNGLESGNYNFTPAAASIGINSTEQGQGEAKSTKITLNQIRAKQKEARQNQQESIDKGIETGLSMATSGENLGRASGEKISFKKRGRAGITETIGAGGEDATSNSDNNELELKRKGINLKSFKANRSISS